MSRTATDELWKLLPPYASDLERDVLALTPFDGTLDPLVPRISSSKLTDIPDNWLPWLIIEYGFANLQEFLDDPRELIEQGLLLRRERGTPAALKRAMSWLGLTVTVIEETTPGLHGYEYQLDIGEIPEDLAIICKIVKLARIVAPARSRLRRILHGLDNPMFVYDEGAWDAAGWDNYSGVWSGDIAGMCTPPPNVWLSFARPYVGEVTYGARSAESVYSSTVLGTFGFGIYIDGSISVESGGLLVDPSFPSVSGDLIITGDVGIDYEP